MKHELEFKYDLARLYGQDGAKAAADRATVVRDKAMSLFPGLDPIVISAPGRSELAGNHTDHNHGRVLAAAVRLDALAAVGKPVAAKGAGSAATNEVVLYSEGYAEEIRLDVSERDVVETEKGTTASLVRGVAARLHDLGYEVGGFSGFLSSEVPAGSGMSSSACVEVLIGAVFNHLYNDGKIPWHVLAQAGQFAENKYFGKPCGLMDQMACAGGGVLCIDFENPAKPGWKEVDFDFEAAGYVLAIVNTGGSHADLTPHYAAIPAEMKSVAALFGQKTLRGIGSEAIVARAAEIRAKLGDRAVLRALHFIADDKRAAKMAERLEEGDLKKYFKLVRESGLSSWTLLQNVETYAKSDEQNVALGIALSQEILGKRGACRVHGGGFAGTIQAYVPLDQQDEYRERMGAVFGSDAVMFPGIRPVGVVRLA